jgi:hypothetical protein
MWRLSGGWETCNCRAAFEKLRDSAMMVNARKWCNSMRTGKAYTGLVSRRGRMSLDQFKIA